MVLFTANGRIKNKGDILRNVYMKFKYKIFCIVIGGVIAVFISYIALNFR